MDSDKRSIQEQGGGAPKSYSPEDAGGESQQQANKQTPFSSPAQGGGGQSFPPQDENKGNSPRKEKGKQFPPVGKGGGQEKESFPPKPSSMPGGEPPKEGDGKVEPIGSEKPAGPPEGGKGKSGKKLFTSLLAVIIVVGILVAGYFFVYPMLKEKASTDTDTNNQPAGTSTEPIESEGEQVPVVEEGDGFEVPTVPSGRTEATSTEATTTEGEAAGENGEEESQPSAGGISADAHVSIFSTPADSTVKKILEEVNLESIKSALEISSTEVPLFREIVPTDGEDNLIQSGELFSALAPNTFTEDVLEGFEADSTLFTYTDDSGTWFGLGLNAKSSAELSQLKSDVAKIEDNLSEVKNFFLSDPGDEASWKDGGAEGVTSRYISFSAEGASFNYGWSNDILIISGSYSAFSEAVKRL